MAAIVCFSAIAITPSDMTVVINPAGVDYAFDRANGTDQGDYVDPQGRFTVGCILATNPQLPGFRVYFRSDADGCRDEVVFEYGDPWATGAPADLGAYTATITKSGTTVATIAVPAHYWMARWRWFSAPRAVSQSIAQLNAAKLLPVFDASQLGVATRPFTAKTYSPMGFAGLSCNMCITGDRGDIGLVTEWQADYICYGQNLPTVLAQAEAAGSFPIAFRDTRSGAPLDCITYPNASTQNVSYVSPLIKMTAPRSNGTPVIYEDGHSPAMSYLPFLLTGDPYYLEGLQFQVIADLVSLPYSARYKQVGRYLAWPLRNMFSAVAATPSSVPSWLLPKARMQAVLDAMYGAVTSRTITTPTDLYANFGLYTGPNVWPTNTMFAFWQNDMLALVLGFGLMLGHSEWQAIAQGVVGCGVTRASGNGGWPRSRPTLYDSLSAPSVTLAAAVTNKDTTITVSATIAQAVTAYFTSTATPQSVFPSPPFTVMIDNETMTVTGTTGVVWPVTRGSNPGNHVSGRIFYGPNVTTWPALWNLCATEQALPAGNNDALQLQGAGSITYVSYLRGALAMADQVGLPGVTPVNQWLTQQMVAVARTYPSDRKWMIRGS
jgi:hypothetical protein